MKKSKTKKMAAWLNLSVMSALTVTAIFSPVAASAALNNTKDNVAAEEFDLLKLTNQQAAPFIEKAKEALKAKNIALPTSGYKLSSSSRSYDDVLESVQITWRPDAGQKEGKYYSVRFADVNLEKGTGKIDDVYVDIYDELIALEEEPFL
ncbi:hypothetical protein [Brevibacillus sp. 179-C9.3 HS]|uniref:hypothetical protein n=1 Tax=unclassified Brevibacillus TaxID=2684853 RepID=UPI0039A09560